MGSSSDKFKWSDREALDLVEACLNFIGKYGRKSCFKWKDIQMNVEAKIGRKFTNVNSCKHNYDSIRKDWVIWKNLKRADTGLGWDPVSGTIEASPEWWQTRIKENKEYQKFRFKGVSADLEEKWNQLFGESYATGTNAYAPSMEPPSTEPQEDKDDNNGGSRNFQSLDDYLHSSDISSVLPAEDNFLSQFLGECCTQNPISNICLQGDTSNVRPQNPISNLCLGGGTLNVVTHDDSSQSQAAKKSGKTALKTNATQMKHRRRQSAGSAFLSDQISDIKEIIKKVADGSSTDENSISSGPTIPLAMQIIKRMVDNGDLVVGDELWCFANTIVEDPTRREMFVNFDDDFSRLKWMQYLHNSK